MKNIGPLALIACGVTWGCTFASTGVFYTSDLRPPARPETCALDVFLDRRGPVQPYRVIARVATEGASGALLARTETQITVLNRLRAKACTAGAQAMFDVDVDLENDGGARSSTGSALAAVYVDSEGRPLPPPAVSIAAN